MSIFTTLEENVAVTRKAGRYRDFINLERQITVKPRAIEHGIHGPREVNVWCSNDYLTLSQHEELGKAAIQAVQRVGVGTGGVRTIAGTSIYHTELEEELTRFYEKEAALLFTTGYTANAATLTTIGDYVPGIVIFSDELNHASMIQGIRYSKAEKRIFRHNDMAHLEELLLSYPPERPKLIAFESLYSMEGDFSLLPEIVVLAKKYNASTYLDEIHAAGVYGVAGAGYAEHLGVLDKIDIIQAGFGKAFGAAGGYITGPRALIDAVRCYAPGFIFSTSMPAPVVAAALASVRYNRTHSHLREALFERVAELKAGLQALSIPIISAESHIVPILVGNPFRCKEISRRLLNDFGIYVQPVNAPTVPEGTERLRVTPTSGHTSDDVKHFLAAISEVWRDQRSDAA